MRRFCLKFHNERCDLGQCCFNLLEYFSLPLLLVCSEALLIVTETFVWSHFKLSLMSKLLLLFMVGLKEIKGKKVG